ncbi:isoflavone reductase family protein [Fimicolochytrium jonesii]|uniref:isoflavone reductase family protein n=1 Tax=Fimicolochytrium jonesii TaxID=1396493 RepID=UPI0022FEC6B2|nr:isoflavone reductase family protein [Fimicolochytrium jonesii]KAI8821167.1 isoflavone reductase family protein [Fimicolochytrium jonesii]
MMSPIKNVMLIGAGGNLGPSILQALLDAHFTVSILARESSQSTFPPTVTVHRTDYSYASLLAVFQGQDAVVSALGSSALEHQNVIVDAAVGAGVKRFIPSEFGCNTVNRKGAAIVPFFQAKVDQVEYLKRMAAAHPSFTWSSVITGGFFDWSLKTGFSGYDLNRMTATIYDDGTRRTSTSTLKTIGLAVARTLLHPAETANTYLYIQSFAVSQNEVLAALEAVKGVAFAVTHRTTEAARMEGAQKLAAGDIMAGYLDLIMAAVCSPGTGNDFEQEVEGGTTNSMLGLPKETLEEAIKEALA